MNRSFTLYIHVGLADVVNVLFIWSTADGIVVFLGFLPAGYYYSLIAQKGFAERDHATQKNNRSTRGMSDILHEGLPWKRDIR